MLEIFKTVLVKTVWSEARLLSVTHYDGMNKIYNYLICFDFVLLTQLDTK
jgi:hypothetical protein